MSKVLLTIVLIFCGGQFCRAAESMPGVKFELFAKVEERPVFVTHDGKGRIFIVEQPGRVRVVSGGKLLEKPFLDMSEKIPSQGECGLLGLAFHPKFAENGLFYVDYTEEKFGEVGPTVKQGNKTVTQKALRTVIVRDITARKLQEQRLQYEATHFGLGRNGATHILDASAPPGARIPPFIANPSPPAIACVIVIPPPKLREKT